MASSWPVEDQDDDVAKHGGIPAFSAAVGPAGTTDPAPLTQMASTAAPGNAGQSGGSAAGGGNVAGSAGSAASAGTGVSGLPVASMAASRTAMRRSKRPAERSCILCHRRKVRCDKNIPCGNCRRSGVLCCYPDPERAPRQPKTTIADIASRLVQLERTLVAVSGADLGGDDGSDNDFDAASSAVTQKRPANRRIEKPAPGGRATRIRTQPAERAYSRVDPAAPSVDNDDDGIQEEDLTSESAGAAEEILLKNPYASRYINEILLSRVLEEEHEIQSVLAPPKNQDEDHKSNTSPFPVSTSLSLVGMLSANKHFSLQILDYNLLPSKVDAVRLWSAYLQNVEPFNKLVHVPTIESEVFTAIEHPQETKPPMACLVFSIYYVAVVSYAPEDYKAIYGREKSEDLERYRAGLDRALVESNFLETPSLRILQSIAMFLRMSRANHPGRSPWILYGLAMRAAQCIGLHRDGTNFGLSPFETEMRRRLWWHLSSQDARAGEDHGISVSSFDPKSDMQFPLNVNDNDLYPDMKELPQPRKQWTELSLLIGMVRLSHTMQLLAYMLNTASPPLTEARRNEVCVEHTAYIDDLMSYCNPVIPIQRVTLMILRLVKLKLDFVSRLQLTTSMMAPDNDSDGNSNANANGNGTGKGSSKAGRMALHATDENFKAACDLLEINADFLKDELLRSFWYSCEIYPQYQILLYVVWHLCVKPSDGNDVARAWRVLDVAFEAENSRQRRQTAGSFDIQWSVLTALRSKAVRIRDSLNKAHENGNTTAQPAVPEANTTSTAPTSAAVPVAAEKATMVTVDRTGGQHGHPGEGHHQEMGLALHTPHTAHTAGLPNNMLPTPDTADATLQQELLDTDMMNYLQADPFSGDAWNENFMDWNSVSNDFLAKNFGFGSGSV